jgi:Gpi18-like mannosyltransferase
MLFMKILYTSSRLQCITSQKTIICTTFASGTSDIEIKSNSFIISISEHRYALSILNSGLLLKVLIDRNVHFTGTFCDIYLTTHFRNHNIYLCISLHKSCNVTVLQIAANLPDY